MADVVVIVSEGVAGGVAESGLGVHTGGLVVTGPVPVGVQLNMTGLSKPEDGWRSIVPVADPPGFTAGVMSPPGRLMVKSCPKARDADAAENINSDNAKTIERRTCLELTMSG